MFSAIPDTHGGEITEGSQVQSGCCLSQRERAWQETRAPDEESGEIKGMTRLSLSRALRDKNLKTEPAEQSDPAIGLMADASSTAVLPK